MMEPAVSSKQSWRDMAWFDLSQPHDALALVERFQGEWYNGGFPQLFSNWYRADIVLIPEALRIVGAPEAAPIVEAAIAEFPTDQDNWRDLGHEAMMNYSNPVGSKLRDMDRAFDAHEKSLAKAVEAFELKLSEGEDP